MTGISGFADVNGTRLYYEVAGVGHPLVFLHGSGLDTRMWDDQFELFAERYRVIRYDYRGHGRSMTPPQSTYTDHDDLKAMLDYLGVSRAHIVGLSGGGGIAVDFALAYPEATTALVPVDSSLGGYQSSIDWGPGPAQIGVEAAKAGSMAHPIFGPAMERPEAATRLKEMNRDYSGWHWLNQELRKDIAPPAIERLDGIRAPTLVVVGERDLPDFHEIADILTRGIPRAGKIVLRGVGHMSNMEDPRAFNEAVLSFLEGLTV